MSYESPRSRYFYWNDLAVLNFLSGTDVIYRFIIYNHGEKSVSVPSSPV